MENRCLPVGIFEEHQRLKRTPFLLSWLWHYRIKFHPDELEITNMLHGSRILLVQSRK